MTCYQPPPRRLPPGIAAARYVVGVAVLAALLTAMLAAAPVLAALINY